MTIAVSTTTTDDSTVTHIIPKHWVEIFFIPSKEIIRNDLGRYQDIRWQHAVNVWYIWLTSPEISKRQTVACIVSTLPSFCKCIVTICLSINRTCGRSYWCYCLTIRPRAISIWVLHTAPTLKQISLEMPKLYQLYYISIGRRYRLRDVRDTWTNQVTTEVYKKS